MYSIREWFETEKSKHDAEWANRVIRTIRMNWQPMISQDEAERGMRYLLGCQDLDFIKRMFQNTTRMNLTNEKKGSGIVNGFGQPVASPHDNHDDFLLNEMSPVNFKPLPIMEKLRNVLIAEMKKMGPVINVRSEDPTTVSKKIKDRATIENKKRLEGLLSYVYTSLNERPYRMKDHEARFGEKPGNGNINQFESMGLDNEDPTDVDFFMDHFHKLDEEIAAEAPINYAMMYNRVLLDFEKWVNDIIAKKCVAATCYVSDVTGAVCYKYLAPETVWIYGSGNRQDFNDANAKGYERKITIREMLDIIGNKFDFEKNWNILLQAITNTNNIEFTGVKPSYRGFVGGSELEARGGMRYKYDDFMSFKVTLGYIEFSSQNQETFDSIKTNDSFYQDNQSPNGKYAEKARWETPLYKAYYLAVTSIEQVLFDFGMLPYNDIEGACDVSVAGTIITYKETGDPIAIMAAPLLDIMNEAWFKFRYELRRAKPRGRGWNYNSMISTLMDLIPDTNISEFNKLQKVMEMLDTSANEIYSFPIGQDGKEIPLPGNQLNYDIPNGITKESMQWWEIIVSVGAYLSDLIGISDLRQGDSGGPRESMNNQFKALEYSQAATYYVPDMLTTLMQQLSIKTNFYVQDIITYKSHNTMAYKFLEDAIGLDTIQKLEKLGKTSLHRFGIFVESLNQGPLRQKLEETLFEAVKNKTISTAEQLLVSDIKSTKKAYLTFAYFEQRNKKIAQKNAEALQQQQNEAQMAIKKMEMDTEMLKAKTAINQANIQANAMIQSHIINQQGGLSKTVLKVTADKEQVYHEAQADLYRQQATMNAAGQTTAPPPPMPQQPPPQGGGMMPPPPSDAAQLRQDAEPAPTEGVMM